MVNVLGTAEFSEDMAETLQTYFREYAVDGIVQVEVTDHGLWLVNPDGKSRQFLGLARFPSGVTRASGVAKARKMQCSKLN